MKVLLIICASALWMVSADEDYCNIKGCEGQPHIGCKHSGVLSKNCRNKTEIIPLDAELQKRFIDLHNELREKIASGKLPNYKPAAQMGSVTWDKELAKLALLNLMPCTFDHDLCRSTKTFMYAGQNLAMSGSFPAKTPMQAVEISFKSWYDEHVNGDMSLMNKFYETAKTTGHFTSLANERNSKIGCALLRTPQLNGPATEYYCTCNYARTNVLGEYVYKSGKPLSGCKSGKHPIYHSLCSTSEKYNV